MADEDRFKQSVIMTIAKRAANMCSNPDCGAITSGPSDNPSKAVNVGEAAHIYGAHPGSARFDPDMSSADRAAITNAIWLCGNCHKLVDDDPTGYPAGLLFEWLQAHERHIAREVGKAGATARQRYEARHLEEFGKLSYLAERIIVEKGDRWEYRLTAEALRFEMAPVLRRWNALRRGLYIKPSVGFSIREFAPWVPIRMNEARNISAAFSGLLNDEFARAWGAPGEPGDDVQIVETCRLFAEMCASALAWEETVRFVKAPEVFQRVLDLLQGTVGQVIDEASRVPAFLAEASVPDAVPGTRTLNLALTLPPGWEEQMSEAIETATANVISGIESGELIY